MTTLHCQRRSVL